MAATAPEKASTAAIALATAIVSGIMGYYLGQAQSIGVFGGSSAAHPSLKAGKRVEDSDISDAGSDSEDAQELGDLKSFQESSEECKLVLVVRTDLGMTKGKPGIDFQFPFIFPSHCIFILYLHMTWRTC
jgi:hypothetical protein